jgi:hypothetical protein
MARYYYLGPWQVVTERGQSVVFNGQTLTSPDRTVLSPPEGTVGLVDLRPPHGQGGYGFFATDRPLDSNYEPFGDGINRLEDVHLGAQQRSRWASMLGMSSPTGTTLMDVLWETLTVQADPTGEVRALPIMPTHRGMLELHLAGHSLLRAQRLTRNHPAFQTVCRALQGSYGKINAKGKGAKLAGQWLEVQRRKLHLSADEAMDLLIPPGLAKEPPGKPTTTIQDDFERGDDYSGLGIAAEGWSWSEQTGFGVFGLTATYITGAAMGRAEIDLSSDDHFSQVDIVTMPSIGVIVRATTENVFSGTNSYYSYVAGTSPTNPTRLYKTVNDSTVAIDGGATQGGSPIDAGGILRLQCDGSTLTGYVNGQQSLQVTDTAISGNLRLGLRGIVSGSQVDNFQAADLVPAPGGKRHVVGGGFF